MRKVHEIHKYRNYDAYRGLAKSESGRLNLFSLLKTLFYVCNDRLMRGMQQDSAKIGTKNRLTSILFQ